MQISDSYSQLAVIDQILKHVFTDIEKRDKLDSIVVLHDDFFSTKKICSWIRDATKREIIEYPSSEDQATSTQKLKNFLFEDKNILVTHEKYFRGCEASNIIYFTQSDENVRSSITRCIDNLYVIQSMKDDHEDNKKVSFVKDYKFVGFKKIRPYSHPNPFVRFLYTLSNLSLPNF